MDSIPVELIVLVLTVPIFLHFIYFRPSSLATRPSILILGPSGSGKTSLLVLLDSGQNAATHTSQTSTSVELSLPDERTAGQDKYRSLNDPSSQAHKKFILVDTPGHGKLRHCAIRNITKSQNLKGIIFIVDATSLTTDQDGLKHASEYLYDILLLLQKRAEESNNRKGMSVLIAANKMDLFTALPVELVRKNLELEITKVRNSRSKKLLDSGIDMGDGTEDENYDWLGEMGSKNFKFSEMEEFAVTIEVHEGYVLGNDPCISKWWTWISERL